MKPIEDETEEQLENETRILADELQKINGIEDVSFATKEEKIMEGAPQLGEIINLAELILTFITSGGLVASINLLKSWVENRKRKIIVVTPNRDKLDLENISKEELDKLLNFMDNKK